MSGVTVSRHGDRLVAVKRAVGDLGRLRAEADTLRDLDHPGVVRFVAFDETGDDAELRTEYVGTDTWARTPPSNVAQVLSRLTSVAETLADLHERGIAHGALQAEHVIDGYDGRPVLCGLADAAPLDETTELDDMVGFAGLLRDLAPVVDGPTRDHLDRLARDAAAGAVDARGAAAALALHATDPVAATSSPGNRRAVVVVGGFVAAAALFTMGLGRDTGARAEPSATASEAGVTTPTTTTTLGPTPTTTAPTTPPSTSAPPTTAPPTTAVPVIPVPTTTGSPGDVPGIELVHEGRRYGLGADGDQAVVGDWDCDGVPTPALLQFGSGVIAVFDAWPDPDEPLTAAAVDVAPDATAIEAVEQDGCHRLRILEPAGSRLFDFALETS